MTGIPITQSWLGGRQEVSINTPSGCTTGAAGCVTTQQEVIGYTAGGDPISKGPSSSPWMAWVPTVTTMNQDGTAYQPYTQGIPYTLQGGSVVKWDSTDSQALAYLDSAPGAGAREAYQERTCSPLMNVFGCKESDPALIDAEIEGSPAPAGFWAKFKTLFGAESSYAAESKLTPTVLVGMALLGGYMVTKK